MDFNHKMNNKNANPGLVFTTLLFSFVNPKDKCLILTLYIHCFVKMLKEDSLNDKIFKYRQADNGQRVN